MRKIIGRYGLTGKQQVSGGVCGEGGQRAGELAGCSEDTAVLAPRGWELFQTSCLILAPETACCLAFALGYYASEYLGLFKGRAGTGCQSLTCLCPQTAG